MLKEFLYLSQCGVALLWTLCEFEERSESYLRKFRNKLCGLYPGAKAEKTFLRSMLHTYQYVRLCKYTEITDLSWTVLVRSIKHCQK